VAAAGLTGGEALRAKLAEIAKQIEGKHVLRVGFLEGATYPDEAGTSVGQVAWWLNYGTKSAPPRPFFSGMVAAKSSGWGDSLARILAGNGFDVTDALNKMGEGISNQLRVSLETIPGPQLSPITLMIRQMRIDNPHLNVTGATVGQAAARVAAGDDYSGASTKIGVYTGHLLNSISYEVK
jgi:hypothetical protein